MQSESIRVNLCLMVRVLVYFTYSLGESQFLHIRMRPTGIILGFLVQD